jgi:type II secretory pathway pseudopilin PulG
VEIIKARMAKQQQEAMAMQQQQMMLEQQGGQAQAGGTPPNARPGATLENGAPVTNNFAPLGGVGS